MKSGFVVARASLANFCRVVSARLGIWTSALRHKTNSVHDEHLKCLRRRSSWKKVAGALHSGHGNVILNSLLIHTSLSGGNETPRIQSRFIVPRMQRAVECEPCPCMHVLVIANRVGGVWTSLAIQKGSWTRTPGALARVLVWRQSAPHPSPLPKGARERAPRLASSRSRYTPPPIPSHRARPFAQGASWQPLFFQLRAS